MKTTVFCVAAESLGSGAVNWHPTAASADEQYDAYVADPDFAADTISRFDLELDDQMSPDQVTAYVDDVMWGAQYEPLRRRIGTDQVLSDSAACASV